MADTCDLVNTGGVHFGVNTEISSSASLGNHVLIGPNAEIGDNVQVGDCVAIGPNVIIADGAVIGSNVGIQASAEVGKDAVIGPNVEIKASAEVGKGAYVGPNSVIGANAEIAPHASVKEGSHIAAGAFIGAAGSVQTKAGSPDTITIVTHGKNSPIIIKDKSPDTGKIATHGNHSPVIIGAKGDVNVTFNGASIEPTGSITGPAKQDSFVDLSSPATIGSAVVGTALLAAAGAMAVRKLMGGKSGQPSLTGTFERCASCGSPMVVERKGLASCAHCGSHAHVSGP